MFTYWLQGLSNMFADKNLIYGNYCGIYIVSKASRN